MTERIKQMILATQLEKQAEIKQYGNKPFYWNGANGAQPRVVQILSPDVIEIEWTDQMNQYHVLHAPTSLVHTAIFGE